MLMALTHLGGLLALLLSDTVMGALTFGVAVRLLLSQVSLVVGDDVQSYKVSPSVFYRLLSCINLRSVFVIEFSMVTDIFFTTKANAIKTFSLHGGPIKLAALRRETWKTTETKTGIIIKQEVYVIDRAKSLPIISLFPLNA